MGLRKIKLRQESGTPEGGSLPGFHNVVLTIHIRQCRHQESP